MSPFIIIFFLMCLFLLIETPLFTVIAGLSIACFYFTNFEWLAIQMILIEMNRLASMPVIVALPLFVCAGCLLTETNSPRRIMNFLQAAVGWMPGGLAIAAVCACAFFAALTGASGIAIVALGGMLFPMLRENKYNETFTLGLLTTSGSLGLLFPPSLPIILYGVVAQVNISSIFRAAFIPGIISILVLSSYAAWHHFFRPDAEGGKRRTAPFSWKILLQAFINAMWDWPIILIIIAGVYGGFVTIAEVSALVLVYIIFIECVVIKEVHFFKQLPGIIIESMILSGAVIIILSVALGFTAYLVDEQIPNQILHHLTQVTDSRLVFLLALNIFLLLAGCLMDVFSAIVIIVPIITPIALNYGVNPIHLCVIFLLNLEIGYATPPVGMNLFIASLKFQRPVTVLYRASLPYLALLILLLILVTYVPGLSLWLVE
jgi:C4-dicarboxylate transporter DctM subunit